MFNTALTLICNPAAPTIDAKVLSAIRGWLKSWASGGIERVILRNGVAVDFLFNTDMNLQAAQRTAAIALRGLDIDVAIQPTAHRRKKLLIADMDSTIIEQECIDELAEFVGKRAEISDITERAMRGELDFEAALKERVAMLKGLSAKHLEAAFRERITLTPGAKMVIQTMRARGAFTALVSGGFTFFTERVAAAAGFDVNEANQLMMAQASLTGEVGEPVLGRAAKEEALRRHAAAQSVKLTETIAVGDGANDLSMLASAGLGVAFRAKPAVADAADVSIQYGDLTALLYLQGIAYKEFADVRKA
ncbi:MAG: phosphoserine phosphatase SerB [Pseudomonadota bacterium]